MAFAVRLCDEVTRSSRFVDKIGKSSLSIYVISMRQTLFPFVLFLFWLMFSPECLAEGYELGQGWPVGKYLLSGYANIELVDRFDAPAKLDLDDLSLSSLTINEIFLLSRYAFTPNK